MPITALVAIPALLLALTLSSAAPLPENQVPDDRLVEVLNLAGDPAEARAARPRLERDLDDGSDDLRTAAAKPDTIHTGILWSLSEGAGVGEAVEPVYAGILTDRSPASRPRRAGARGQGRSRSLDRRRVDAR